MGVPVYSSSGGPATFAFEHFRFLVTQKATRGAPNQRKFGCKPVPFIALGMKKFNDFEKLDLIEPK